MESVLKADIFFFITAVAVAAVGIGVLVVIFYTIRILRDIKDVSNTVKTETKEVAQDISLLRSKVKSGRAISGILAFLRGMFARSKKGRKH